MANRTVIDLTDGADFDAVVDRADAAMREPFELVLAGVPFQAADDHRERLHQIAVDAWHERVSEIARRRGRK